MALAKLPYRAMSLIQVFFLVTNSSQAKGSVLANCPGGLKPSVSAFSVLRRFYLIRADAARSADAAVHAGSSPVITKVLDE